MKQKFFEWKDAKKKLGKGIIECGYQQMSEKKTWVLK